MAKKNSESWKKETDATESRSWCGTISAALYTREEVIEALDAYDAYIGQLERGKKSTEQNPEGFLHWQIYVEHTHQIRRSTLRNKLRGDWRTRYKTKRDAYEYCIKEDTREPGHERLEKGTFNLDTTQGRRTDLDAMKDAILWQNKTPDDVILSHGGAWRYGKHLEDLQHAKQRAAARGTTREIAAGYLWGATNAFRTRMTLEAYGAENVYIANTARTHPFDDYQGEQVLLLSGFDSKSMKMGRLAEILSPFSKTLEARFRNKPACFTTVVISSAYPWGSQYQAEKIAEQEERIELTESIGTFEEITRAGEFIDHTQTTKAEARKPLHEQGARK